MSLDDPAIITCSISGALANREQCPAIPYTPEEYASEARRIVDEGGVHIHIHARKPDGTPSYEVEDFQNIKDAIVAEVGDAAIINFSTGTVGVSVEKRVAYLREVRPEVAALNMGSMNYAKYSASRKDFVFKTVFENSFDEIIELLNAMNELGIRPEHECFDVGHVGSLAPLVDMGVLHEPLHVDLVMGVTGGVPATARNLAMMADNVPDGAHWGVIGISRVQWMLVAAALTLGGSIRVGLEDNLYLPDGTMATSNGELIAKARQLTEDIGRRPATVEEARSKLGLPAPAVAPPRRRPARCRRARRAHRRRAWPRTWRRRHARAGRRAEASDPSITAIPMLRVTPRATSWSSSDRASATASQKVVADHDRVLGGHAPQQHAELVASHAARRVAAAQTADQRQRHRLDHLVADGVPRTVVDLLEPVQVDGQYGTAAALAPAGCQLARQLVQEAPAVEQPAQGVVVGHVAQLLLAALARVDVQHL